jgi:hypothetical protein
MRKGSSLIDVVFSIGIVVLLFGAIYMVYFSLYNAIANIEARDDATAVMNQQIETMRNMPYADIGVVGGIPPGLIQPQQSIPYGSYTFVMSTDIMNIEDPAGQGFGEPTGTVDYKLAQFTISCPTCQDFNPLSLTTTFAPVGLQSAAGQGSLFVNVFDSNGNGVPGATVNVVNSNITPVINLTDTTNNSGTLQLVGVPTSTQGYQIFVSKSGYSSAQTYPTGGAGNPNPVQPNITVAQEQLSTVSFAIDRTSTLTVSASNNVCMGIGGTGFSITGSKIIGTSPNVLKFATTSTTNASGTISFPGMEWDTYSLALTSSSYALLGTNPLTPTTINPSSTVSFDFVLTPSVPKSLLVTVTDASTGAGVPAATVTLAGNSFSQTLTSGQSTWTDTNWSNNAYAAQSGGIDTQSVPGTIQLLANASGTYNTATTSWLISNTIDFGTSSANEIFFNVNPATEPPSTGAGSAEFQLAANNDNATWNFAGPDGTSGTYYPASSTIVNLNGDRYLRYEIFLSTQDPATTPYVNDITVGFSSPCLPQSQVLFSGLSSGSYTLTVTAPNYLTATSSVSVSSNTQSTSLSMTHQ